MNEGEYNIGNITINNIVGTISYPTIIKADGVVKISNSQYCRFLISSSNFLILQGPIIFTNFIISIFMSSDISINNVKVNAYNKDKDNQIWYSNNIEISNGEISNGNQIKIDTSDKVKILNCLFYNNNIGININSGNYITIYNNTFKNNIKTNLLLTSSNNNIISGNYFFSDSEKEKNVDLEDSMNNFILTNNIIIGGLNSLNIVEQMLYNNSKIINNIIGFSKNNTILMNNDNPSLTPNDCSFQNNFINGNVSFFKETSWTISNNYFYGTDTVPLSDATGKSKASKNITLDNVFYYKKNICNYSKIHEEMLDINCYMPIRNIREDFELYKQGTPVKEVTVDIIDQKRSETTPSIGVFENIFYSYLTINVEYCLYSEDSSLSLKLIIEDEEKKIFKIFERMGKCLWTYPIDEYKYIKFILVLAKDDSILRWNTNYFVEYNITELNEYFKEEKSANGIKYINSPNDNFQTIMYIKNGLFYDESVGTLGTSQINNENEDSNKEGEL